MDRTRRSGQADTPDFPTLESTPVSYIPQDSPPPFDPLPPFPQHSKRKYPCHLCPMDFGGYPGLYRHTIRVHNVNPKGGIRCTLCSQYYTNLKGLSVHLAAKHRTVRRTDLRDEEEDRCRKKRRLNQEEEHAEKTEIKDEDVKDPIYCVESNPIISPQTSKLEPLPQSLKTEETQVICSICHEELERDSAMEHLREHDDLADGLLESFVATVTKAVTANVLMTLQVMGSIGRR